MPSKTSSRFANINPNVFVSTIMIIAIFLAIVILAPDAFELLTQQLKTGLQNHLVGSMYYRLPSF